MATTAVATTSNATTTTKTAATSVWRRRSSSLAAVLGPTGNIHQSLLDDHHARPSIPPFAAPAATCNPARSTTAVAVSKRSHYSYADGPGRFGFSEEAVAERHSKRLQNWDQRGFTVGIGGPVGSGKTALVLALIKRLGVEAGTSPDRPPLAVVTNDIFTQEDAQFLWRNQDVLDARYIKAVETGGCPHAAIREDVSANLTACEDLTDDVRTTGSSGSGNGGSAAPPLILCESGGDNLAANFSSELADLTLYVIDVAGGDKVPRKGGPGITQSDLLIINKIDLAEAVGADLGVMRRDADKMRRATHHDHDHDHDHSHGHDHSHDHSTSDDNDDFHQGHPDSGPTVFASVKKGTSLDEIEAFILEQYRKATAPSE